METFGNIESLEKKIEAKYQSQIREIEASAQKEADGILDNSEKQIAVLLEQAKTDAKEAALEAKQRVFNEQKLVAKKEFEFAREKFIQQVFEEVKIQAPIVALTKEYIKFAKQNAPAGKKVVVYANSPKYRNFFPKMVLDKSIIGIRFESENLVHDLSIDGALTSKSEEIRRIIISEMFGEK